MATKFKSSVEIDGYLSLTSGNWVQVPDGTTAQRPGSPTVGMFRYNTTTDEFEGYFGSTPAWGAIGGGGSGTVTEAFKTIAVSGQSDIVADGPTDTLNVAAGNNITLTTDAATDTLTIGCSGSGGGTVTVERNNYTADGSTTAFGVSSTIVSENNIQVYLDGVYQDKDTFTISGTTVTFGTAPPNTTEVEIIHFVSISGVIAVDRFTGTGSQASFSTSLSIGNENATQVYLDGVYQSKLNYQTTGNVVSFNTPPPNGVAVEIVHMKPTAVSGINKNNFTGDGTSTAFTLSTTVDEENLTFVFLEGVYQDKSTYSISGTTLTFTTAPQNGYGIEVMAVTDISISTNLIYTDTFTGNGSQTLYVLGITPNDLNSVDVYLDGLYQNTSTLTLVNNNLTFATAPPNNVNIEVKSFGNVNIGGTLAPATITGGTGIDVTTTTSNNFTITNTLSAGIDWETTIHTTAVSANLGKGYIVNTTAGEVTVNLPAGIAGNIVAVQDYAGTFDTNKLIINSNGTEKIQGSTDNYQCTTENATVYLLYQDATQGWTADNIEIETTPLTVNYLVVAGGGSGGGNEGGGGGAGGYRTSYGSTTGGGGSAETALSLLTATNYTLTVGAGGTVATPTPYYQGGDGSNSVFATITSTGGGGGGTGVSGLTPDIEPGRDGGSGGGGSRGNNVAKAGGARTNPPIQGYAGGASHTTTDSAGGGGGAGAVGTTATGGGGFDGGDGLSNSITGTATFYAGGGGGGSYSTIQVGAGGQGGGGTGINTGPIASSNNGVANTGGGAGGGGGSGADNIRGGATGGSGVVILRYSNAFTISGLSGTTITSGSDKITTFTNAGTGNIQFN